MSATRIQLSRPTNRTLEGPRLRLDRNQLIVEYDCQADDGSVEWSKIVFGEVLAAEYRQNVCCDADSIIDAREVRSTTEPSRLAEVLKVWNESVGWQEWQQKQGGASRFKHFTVFFDDAGCVDAIAASCDVA